MRTVSRSVYVDGIPVPLGVRKGFADVDNRADTKSTSIRLPKRGAPFNPLLPLPEVRDHAVVPTKVVKVIRPPRRCRFATPSCR